MTLPAEAFQTITWREGATEPLSGRFAACACGAPAAMQGGTVTTNSMLADRVAPAGQAEPVKFVLSTMPEDPQLSELVGAR